MEIAMSATPNRASQPAGKSKRKSVSHDLPTARQMLPLVKVIITEVVDQHERLAKLAPERDTLEEYRRSLTWESRRRRYALNDEMTEAEKVLAGASAELESLGVALVDPAVGQVDFPTRINGRPAAFSWQLGEDSLGHWHYSGEATRRTIPAEWQTGTALRMRAEP